MITVQEARTIIAHLPSEFDSHQFIELLVSIYSGAYIEISKEFGSPTEAHRQIGLFLLNNSKDLEISKIDTVTSENIYGKSDSVALWRKI